MVLLEYDKLLVTAKAVLTGININIENYRQITELSEFLDQPEQDEIFTEQRRRLRSFPPQIEADLLYWQLGFQQIKDDLDIKKKLKTN
jgi:hypothetical protein